MKYNNSVLYLCLLLLTFNLSFIFFNDTRIKSNKNLLISEFDVVHNPHLSSSSIELEDYHVLGNLNTILIHFHGDSIYSVVKPGSWDATNYYLVKFSKTGVIQWNKTISWTYTWDLHLFGRIYIDSSNNIYLLGKTQMYYNNFAWRSGPIYIFKFDANGNQLWERFWIILEDEGFGMVYMCPDNSGNFYLSGNYWNDGNRQDMALVKFSNSGNYLWNVTWGSPSNSEIIRGLYLNPTGDIFVLWTEVVSSMGDDEDAWIYKFNSNGELVWDKKWGGTNDQNLYSVCWDSIGNFYTVVLTYLGFGSNDFAIEKHNASGIVQWYKSWGTVANEYGYGTIDQTGNLLILGKTGGDVLLLNYDLDGALLWNSSWGGVDNDWALLCGYDSSLNLILTGRTESYGEGNEDICILVYNSTGELICNATWGGADDDYYLYSYKDTSDNIYVIARSTKYSYNEQTIILKFRINDQNGDNGDVPSVPSDDAIGGYELFLVFIIISTASLIIILNKKRFKL